MYSGAGKDPGSARCDFRRHLAVWYADVRSVLVGSVPGRTGCLRHGARECFQCRRLQTAHAGYFFYQRHVEECDAGYGIWRTLNLDLTTEVTESHRGKATEEKPQRKSHRGRPHGGPSKS